MSDIWERKQRYICVGSFSPSLRKLRFSGGVYHWFLGYGNYLPLFDDLHKKCTSNTQKVPLLTHYVSISMNKIDCLLHSLTQSDRSAQSFLHTTVEEHSLSASLIPPHSTQNPSPVSTAAKIKYFFVLPFTSVYNMKRTVDREVSKLAFRSGLILTVYLSATNNSRSTEVFLWKGGDQKQWS